MHPGCVRRPFFKHSHLQRRQVSSSRFTWQRYSWSVGTGHKTTRSNNDENADTVPMKRKRNPKICVTSHSRTEKCTQIKYARVNGEFKGSLKLCNTRCTCTYCKQSCVKNNGNEQLAIKKVRACHLRDTFMAFV